MHILGDVDDDDDDYNKNKDDDGDERNQPRQTECSVLNT